MEQQDVLDQQEIVRRLLAETRKGEVVWERAGARGSFRASRKSSEVSLGVDERSAARYWLKFKVHGRPEWDTVIRQELPDAEPWPEEEERDALMARLYQLVSNTVAPEPNAAEAFFDDESE